VQVYCRCTCIVPAAIWWSHERAHGMLLNSQVHFPHCNLMAIEPTGIWWVQPGKYLRYLLFDQDRTVRPFHVWMPYRTGNMASSSSYRDLIAMTWRRPSSVFSCFSGSDSCSNIWGRMSSRALNYLFTYEPSNNLIKISQQLNLKNDTLLKY
jgi:hypothetical protein